MASRFMWKENIIYLLITAIIGFLLELLNRLVLKRLRVVSDALDMENKKGDKLNDV